MLLTGHKHLYTLPGRHLISRLTAAFVKPMLLHIIHWRFGNSAGQICSFVAHVHRWHSVPHQLPTWRYWLISYTRMFSWATISSYGAYLVVCNWMPVRLKLSGSHQSPLWLSCPTGTVPSRPAPPSTIQDILFSLALCVCFVDTMTL